MNNSDVKNNTSKNKNSFFKKVIISIKDFDKYNIFAEETVGQALIYLLKMILIFSLIVTLASTYKFYKMLKNIIANLDNQIYSIEYQNNELKINNNEKTIFYDDEGLIGEILIDTSDLTEEQIEQYKSSLNSSETTNQILLLKDKVYIKNSNLSGVNENNYDTLFSKYNIESFNKEDILKYYYNNKGSIYITITLIIFAYMFMVYITNVLLDSLLMGVLCFITAKFAKMKLTYTASFNIAVHSLTLSLILNMIYIVINVFTGFTIRYFQVMYTAIAYVYIVTAVLMIRADYIKRQLDVQKIESEQEKINDELKSKEEERKRQEEKEKVKDKDKKKEKKKSSDKDNEEDSPKASDKPAGSNV